MNKRVPTFLAGMLTTALISSLGVTALAATGRLTIAVDPINIQVNGQTFQPKDAQGNDVPVFSYNGTTYAPLRALAESFGLEVGYDAGANMATVGEKGSGAQAVDAPPVPTPGTLPSATDYSSWSAEQEAEYQDFRGMWDIAPDEGTLVASIVYNGTEIESLLSFLNARSEELIRIFCKRLDSEAVVLYSNIAQNYYYYKDGVRTLLWVDCYSPGGGYYEYSKELINSLNF